jgi:hypothetical protein
VPKNQFTRRTVRELRYPLLAYLRVVKEVFFFFVPNAHDYFLRMRKNEERKSGTERVWVLLAGRAVRARKSEYSERIKRRI